RRDSSGIRFYLGEKLRQHDLGYLTFGTVSNFFGIIIPPKLDQFIIDAYCPRAATKNIPESGITVVSAFPHTHLQGYSMWTKLIRNKTAVSYLFNADSYNFNYQFENRLAKRIQIFPGDEFATRCIYNTMNKDKVTLGGERTSEEMCLHFFTYYPRLDEDLSSCYRINSYEAILRKINYSLPFNYTQIKQWLLDIEWTPESSKEWQTFIDTVPRLAAFTMGGQWISESLDPSATYKDFDPVICQKTTVTTATVTAANTLTSTTTVTTRTTTNTAVFYYQNIFHYIIYVLIFFIIN
ncbi:unnamed protein product, partial [Adineta ricciae]